MTPLKRTVTPIGDQGVLVCLPDEASAVRFATAVRHESFDWMLDVVPAYATVGVFYDLSKIHPAEVMKMLEDYEPSSTKRQSASRSHIIPCCYEMELDLHRVAEHTGLTPDEVIAEHAGCEYTIYAIGFAPGFPYLGYLPTKLCGVPRLPSPRLRVEPGSVGLTGRQTGIYPLVRPGGWNLIGRTPLTLVDVKDGYFPLRVGDRVRFERIDRQTFEKCLGERLSQASRSQDLQADHASGNSGVLR